MIADPSRFCNVTAFFFDIDDTLYSRSALLTQSARLTRPDLIFEDRRFMELFNQFSDCNLADVISGKITPVESNIWRFCRTVDVLQSEQEKRQNATAPTPMTGLLDPGAGISTPNIAAPDVSSAVPGTDVRTASSPCSEEEGRFFAETYARLQSQMTLSESLEKMFTELTQAGVFVGIITDGGSAQQWGKYQKLHLERWIPRSHVLISGEVGHSKPAPEIFAAAWKAAEGQKTVGAGATTDAQAPTVAQDTSDSRRGITAHEIAGGQSPLSPDDFLYVGDSWSHDIAGAQNAGWHTVWMNRLGMQIPADSPAPDAIVQNEAELESLIRQILA